MKVTLEEVLYNEHDGCTDCRHEKEGCLVQSVAKEDLERLLVLNVKDYYEVTIHHCPYSERSINNNGVVERRKTRR